MAQETGFVELDGRRIAYAMVGDGRRSFCPRGG
jgi:hypothetical protein